MGIESRRKVGFILGGMSLVTTLVCFFYIPELKGKTYEEIDVLFCNRVPLKDGELVTSM